MNECREAREPAGGGGGGRRGRAREARSPVSDADPFSVPFPSITPSPPSLARPTHTVPARTRTIWGPIVHTDPRALSRTRPMCVERTRARAHELVRVLNNAYGDRVWLSCTPKDTHARDRFVWTRKTTLLGDRREREFSGSVPTNNR